MGVVPGESEEAMREVLGAGRGVQAGEILVSPSEKKVGTPRFDFETDLEVVFVISLGEEWCVVRSVGTK